MAIPVLDKAACSACGLCIEVCGMDVIVGNGHAGPAINADARCNVCGHCVAVCPQNALTFADLPEEAFAPLTAAEIAPRDMEAFLAAKRSCREFNTRPVEREVIERLIDVARMAPTSINCQERSFLVVTDPEKISKLRAALTVHARSMLRFIRLACGRAAAPFLPPESRLHMGHLRADFETALRHLDRGEDYIFHDAPCLMFFTGIGIDPSGRDHALGAQHYVMLFAETLGLGTCINGYAQSAPKLLAKHLDVPAMHAVYGAIMLGYRRRTYRRRVYRAPATVVYHD